jgi:DNA primase
MSETPKRSPAREAFEVALARFYEVSVQFVNHPALECPEHVRPDNAPQVFRYGIDQAKPIPDLEVTDEGIRATLSFSCTPCKTFVPWACVLGFRGEGERGRPTQRAQLRAV